MKTYPILVVAVLSLALAGCGKKDEAQPPQPNQPSTSNPPAAPKASTNAYNPSGGSLLTAPVDYLGAVAKAKISSEKKIDVAFINQAIEMFSSQEGRNPTDLQELVTKQYIRAIPKPPYGFKIVYDAALGEVKVVKE